MIRFHTGARMRRVFGLRLSHFVLGLLSFLTLPAAAQLDNLEFVGHNEDNPFHLMHAEIVGTKVYISEGLGTGGMETYDISIPTAPVRVDEDGPTTWRTRAYPERDLLLGFSHLEGVQRYEISGPATLVSEYDPPQGTAYEGGALRGDLLYVAAHQRGIEILDLSDPGSMVLAGTIDLGNNAAWDAEVTGHHLLVANGRFGLSVVDLDLIPPQVVFDLPLRGLANDILVDGDVGYLSLGPGGLAVLNLTLPESPSLLDLNEETSGNLTEIDLLGDLLVAGSWSRLETYDVSIPVEVVRTGSEDTQVWAMGASINDEEQDPMIVVADWRGISTYRPNPDPGPDIEISTPRIDFGSVETSADTSVFVYNRGSAILDVTNVIAPSGFTVSPESFAVPAGGSQEVTVTASGTASVRSFVRYLSNDPDEGSLRQYVYKNNTTFPQIGSPAPDFNLLGTDGQMHRLSDLQGNVVFLEFGANW